MFVGRKKWSRLFWLSAALVLSMGASPRPAPKPKRDPVDQLFRRAPMAEASRSIVIPVSTNLHWAFDAQLLRTHTVWSGEGLNLYGPPYHGGKSPFLCTYNGPVLWTMPPFSAWSAGTAFEPAPTLPARSDFKSLSTKGNHVVLTYEIGVGKTQTVTIQESSHPSVASETAITRRFVIGPCPEPLTFLAHSEMGHLGDKADHDRAAWIQRSNDVLLAAVHGPTNLIWNIRQAEVEYEQPLNIERSGESEVAVSLIRGHQTRLAVQIPPHDTNVTVEIESVVCRDASEAKRLAEGIQMRNASETSRPTRGEISRRPSPPAYVVGSAKARPPGGDEYYQIEYFPVPKELMVTGMDWLSNGDLLVCTWPGDLLIVEQAQGPVENVRYRRFASGLNEPLGVKVVSDNIYLVQKSELTRVRDTDADGQADLFESVCNDWGYSGNYHAFAFGPVIDRRGGVFAFLCGQRGRWEVPYVGWAIRIDPSGKIEAFCSGLRAPNGVGIFGPNDDLFVADNQGNWVATSKLSHVQRGRFYGYPSGYPAPKSQYTRPAGFDPPAVWLPRKLSPSASGFVTIEDERFGPFKGQMLIGDFQNAIVMRVYLERVNGEWQGAVWPFARGFLSGVNRLAMGKDGRLYAGGLKNSAWPAAAPFDASLERVRFTGKTPFEIKEVHATSDGFELRFTEPADAAMASDAENYYVSQYTYRYHATYGSPEIDHEGRENSSTEIKVTKALISDDALTVRLVMDGLKTNFVTTITALDLKSASAKPLRHDTLHYTLNQKP